MLRGDVIARLEDVHPDMPWFEANFVRGEGFEQVESLFREERALVDSGAGFDADAWQAVWEKIYEAGVSLTLSDGTRMDRDFAVHVYDDGTARFRY